MSKPMHADRWYETPNVDELRQEFQNAYQVIDSAIDGVNIANYYTKTETNNLLDAFYTSAEVDALVTPSAILTKLLTVDGPSSGLNADLLDGYDHADFAKLTGATFTGSVEVQHGAGEYLGVFRSPSYASLRLGGDANNTWQIQEGASNELRIERIVSGSPTLAALLTTSDLEVDGNPVADYGSNTNGVYTRLYNGIQLAYTANLKFEYSASNSLLVTWNYPAAFTGVIRVVVGGLPTSSGNYNGLNLNAFGGPFIVASGGGTTNANLYIWDNSDPFVAGDWVNGMSAFAIGTWY